MEEKKKNNNLIKIIIGIAILVIIVGLYLLYGPAKVTYLACTEDKTICLSDFKITNDMNYVVHYKVVNRTNKKLEAGTIKGFNDANDDYRLFPFESIEAKKSYEGSIISDAESWKDFQTIKKIVLVKE